MVYNNVINDVGNKLQQVFSKQRSGDGLAHLLLRVQQVRVLKLGYKLFFKSNLLIFLIFNLPILRITVERDM